MYATTAAEQARIVAEQTRQLFEAYPVVVVGSLLTLHYKRTAPPTDQEHIWFKRFMIGLIISSSLWGSTAFLFYPPDNTGYQVFLTFVLSGICAGGIATLSYRRILIPIFLIVLLTPIIIQLFLTNTPINNAMGIMAILFFFTLLSAGRRIFISSENQIILRLEARQREDRLRSARQRESLHFSHTPLAVIEWTLDYKVSAWNPSAERIFGYSCDEALGKHARDLIVLPETTPPTDNIWTSLLQYKDATRGTNNNITKEGS